MKNNFPHNDVNRRIADARTRMHLTQSELADKLGINRSTYAYMEKHGKPSPSRLSQIAEQLNVSVDYLINGTEKSTVVEFHDSGTKTPKENANQPEQFQLTEAEKRVIKMLRMLPHSEAAKIKNDLKDKFNEIFIKD